MIAGLDGPAAAGSPARRQGALRFDRVTVEDGLSGGDIYAIHQDEQGFIWLATSDGLNRFDGHAVKVYKNDPEDPGSLSDRAVLSIYSDSTGTLWVAMAYGGLERYLRSSDSFAHHRHDPADAASLSDDTVHALAEDAAGDLWVDTGVGLDRRRRETGVFEHYRHDPADPRSLRGGAVSSLCVGPSQTLWVGTDGGLHQLDSDGGFRHFGHDPADPRSLGDDEIWAIREDADGRVWIGTPVGLDRLDPASGLVKRFRHDPADPRSLSDGEVFALLIDQRGALWAGTASGISVLDRESGTFDRHIQDLVDPRSLSNSFVISLFEDRTGVLWIGTSDGVSRYDTRRDGFVTYRRQNGKNPTLSGADVWSVVEDRDGELWIAWGAFGLDYFERESGRVVHYRHDPADPESLPPGPTATVFEDRAGVIWVGSYGGGLSRLERAAAQPDSDRDRFARFRHDPADPASLSNDFVKRLFEDRAGGFWVLTLRGLNRFDRKTGKVRRFPARPGDPPSLAEAELSSMAEDRRGRLWIGSFSHGLYRLDPESAASASGRFRQFVHDPQDPGSLGPGQVISLFVDRSGTLWVGTDSGLDRWHAERRRFDHLREKDGLPRGVIRGILEDDSARLWISTNQGLIRFDPASGAVRNYDAHDGLQSNAFSSEAEFKSPSGELFFGGWRGLNAFFPDRIVDDPHPPPVVLTDLRLFNRSVQPRERDPDSPLERSILEASELTLTHRDYVFGIEFAALHYGAPSENRYAYQLQGLDPEWIETDASRRFVQYSNLASGRYVFRVKASNKDGVWNQRGASIDIRVLPAPWRTWWAYVSYAAVLVALISSYVRRQRLELQREQQDAKRERRINARLREVDRLKDEFLTNTSHELRTPLYGITGLAETLVDGAAGEVPEAVKANLSMIVASGRRLSHLVNDILDFSKLRHRSLELDLRAVDLRPLVEVVLTLSRPLVGSKDLQLLNSVPADLRPVEADEERLQQILHNLIGNAMKFTESGTVEVSAAVAEDPAGDQRLRVLVRDTGVGIPKDKQERIFDAFEQGDASVEREFGGTGLGLAVTRELVELHGGTIEVESTTDAGSTFTFTLPIASGETAAPGPPLGTAITTLEPAAIEAAAEARPPAAGRTWHEGARILVVDDEPVNRQVLRNYLTIERFDLTLASSGDEALRLLEEQTFDLVLLDIMMPKVSGYEVCLRLRQKHPLADLPVIFLTAKNQDSDVVAGMSLGANDFLTKPISKDRLLARMRPHLDLLHVHRNLEQLVEEKVSEVKVLSGLLPICAGCKKIRNDEGYWAELEVFIDQHSEAEFTHAMCPDCVEQYYQSAK